MPRGGKRPNAGRKKKWGDKPTVKYVRVVPVEMVEALDALLNDASKRLDDRR